MGVSLNNFDTAILILKIASAGFFSILFLQSGFDKVINYTENLNWLKAHFSKTFLKGSVPFLMICITMLEVASGLFSFAGIFQIFLTGESTIAYYGIILSLLSLLNLFAGQRISKDYAGAASLVSYYVVALISLYILAL